jgi:hypothetical protein
VTPVVNNEDVITVDELFGDINLSVAEQMYKDYKKNPNGNFTEQLLHNIIDDAIEQINYKTGKDNDPKYMAYLLEWTVYSLDQASRVHDGEAIPLNEKHDLIAMDFYINGYFDKECPLLENLREEVPSLGEHIINDLHEEIVQSVIGE